MSHVIIVHKSPSADTRTADHEVTQRELRLSTIKHRGDVCSAVEFLRYKLWEVTRLHDWTKLDYFDEFYKQFHKAQVTGEWGEGWYDQIHIVKERHHLNNKCPDDVNLIDVLEMLCDCVMAGLARSGKYREEEPNPDILVKAYKNTVKMLLNATEVVDE